ncbi:MAG: DNA polymerase I [Candidatus Izemoplasmatales bacterium]|nr:DNA polymerase I [Candidatus Izemoplasmatales bacterium]
MGNKLLLVDASNLLFRSYYATAYTGNLMQTQEGLYTNGIFGFAHAMTKLLENGYTHILVALDTDGKTHRHEMFEEYKGTRKDTPVELIEQFPYMKEYLEALGVYFYEQKSMEADDIIGYVVTHFKNQFEEITIYSNDHDLVQLLDKNVNQIISRKGLKDIEIYTPEYVMEKLGFSTSQVTDYKALVGDASDNIPGVPGIGDKTAVKLLSDYHDIENLYEHIDEIGGKLKERLIENKDKAFFSKKLATIKTDFTNSIDIDKSLYTGANEDMLIKFYQKMNFNSFIKNMKKNTEVTDNEFYVLDTVDKIDKLNYKEAYLHLEIFGENYHTDPKIGFGLYLDNKAYYIPYLAAIKSDKFRNFLSDKKIKKYVYDLKKIKVALMWDDIPIDGMTFDLLLAAYLINPAIKQDDFSLVVQSLDYSEVMSDELVYGKGAKTSMPEDATLVKHVITKVKAIKDLKQIALDKNEESNQLQLLNEMEIPLAHLLSEMEYKGILINQDILNEFGENLSSHLKELETKIYTLAGQEFNINSPKQLGEILFDNLNLPTNKKTKSGYSTDISVLTKLKFIHPIISEIISYRTYSKLYSTYYIGLLESLKMKSDSRIHTIYQQALTKTGRLSSKEPNLQNIPIKTEEGKELRKVFVANKDNLLLSFDYSQIELRVVCELAEIKNLQIAFANNLDIHYETAKKIFGKENINDYERSIAKAINFSIIYGKTAWGLSEDLDITPKEAERFINSYFETYPEIKTYMDRQIEFAENNGYVKTLFNRKTYIPEMKSNNYMTRQFGRRIAMNAPIQGTAADILKIAMVKIRENFLKANLKSQIILQIHDEVVLDVYPEELDLVTKITKETMEKAVPFKTKLVVNYSSGKNLFEVK